MSRNTSTFDALLNIHQEHGKLTPRLVLDAAADPEHALHSRFEWDDKKAGDNYRLMQAAEVIRSVHITRITNTERGPVRVRAFLATPRTDENDADPTDKPESWTYVSIDNLSSDATSAILRQMEKDVASLRRKYRDHKAALEDMLRQTIFDDDQDDAG